MSQHDVARHASEPLDRRIARVGGDMARELGTVLSQLSDGDKGPRRLAASLGLDTVLASRLLKCLRAQDPMAVVYHAPGPEPLRRFLKASRKGGADPLAVAAADGAVNAFDDLIRGHAGDRSSLSAMISSWLPEARAEFEVRRKQTAYRCMSELKGASVQLSLGTVLLHPNGDTGRLDIVWVAGLLGLARLRPDARVKVTTRRFADVPEDRRPLSLSGEPVGDLSGLRLDDFCHAPPARLDVREVGTTVQYLLADGAFGPRETHDFLVAEVNLDEMPAVVPAGSGRLGHVFAEVATPARRLVFDVLVHEDVYPGSDPQLFIYDTALDGVADINDPTRDIDRMHMEETVQDLGKGLSRVRVPEMPRYPDLLAHVFEQVGWDPAAFRTWRTRIEYPLYGSQVAVAFQPPEDG